MPLGFGYQIHRCNVTSGGCQKLNAAPVFAFTFPHLPSDAASTNDPSTEWQGGPKGPSSAARGGGGAGGVPSPPLPPDFGKPSGGNSPGSVNVLEGNLA